MVKKVKGKAAGVVAASAIAVKQKDAAKAKRQENVKNMATTLSGVVMAKKKLLDDDEDEDEFDEEDELASVEEDEEGAGGEAGQAAKAEELEDLSRTFREVTLEDIRR